MRTRASARDDNAVESPAADVGALLRTLFGQHRRRFLIAASELDLHPAQAGSMLQLASPLPMNELATLLACDNSNVTGLVDRLEARGLVARRPSANDRRVKHIVLTDAGGQLRAQMLSRVGHPTPGLNRLSAAEQRQLRDLLRRVLEDDATAEKRQPEPPGGASVAVELPSREDTDDQQLMADARSPQV